MKNVDVPMWDKGDSTDDYAKGGGSHSSTIYKIPDIEDKEKELKEIFFLVLGREPSSRELSYYKYSIIGKGEIVKSLLSSDEHKETIERGIKYPELEKMNKVISSLIDGGANETLLVIDATTGQNGISQAKSFKEITNITGIVLTKLDGTAKGGIVLAIKEEVKLPVKYIGLGEAKEDLQVFDIEKYIYGLFKDFM